MYSAPLIFIEIVKFPFVSNLQSFVGRRIEKQIGLKATEQRISSLLLQKLSYLSTFSFFIKDL